MSPAKTKTHHKLFHTVLQTIDAHHMFIAGELVLVGVSGGPDSIALLHILNSLRNSLPLKLGLAHLNHRLRADDADRDEAFVKSLADRLGLPFYHESIDVARYQQKHRLSLEEAARQVRYRFLNKIAKAHHYTKIALGHHQNDNAEQFLMALLRGSGPLGLAGIPPVRDNIVRPLIHVHRKLILNFLAAEKLPYTEDRSNQDLRFLRNRIRCNLLPELKQHYNPNIIRTISRAASILWSEEEWIETTLDPLYQDLLVMDDSATVCFSARQFADQHLAVQRRTVREAIRRVKGNLRRINFRHVNAVLRLIQVVPSAGQIDLPGKIRIIKEYDRVQILKVKRTLRNTSKITNANTQLSFEYSIPGPCTLFLKEINQTVAFSEIKVEKTVCWRNPESAITFIDKDKIQYPLTLRNSRPGDRFQPLGLNGTQKLKKFFINNKIPRSARAACPVLLSRDRIICIIGQRIDERVKVSATTQTILKAELLLAK